MHHWKERTMSTFFFFLVKTSQISRRYQKWHVIFETIPEVYRLKCQFWSIFLIGQGPAKFLLKKTFHQNRIPIEFNKTKKHRNNSFYIYECKHLTSSIFNVISLSRQFLVVYWFICVPLKSITCMDIFFSSLFS